MDQVAETVRRFRYSPTTAPILTGRADRSVLRLVGIQGSRLGWVRLAWGAAFFNVDQGVKVVRPERAGPRAAMLGRSERPLVAGTCTAPPPLSSLFCSLHTAIEPCRSRRGGRPRSGICGRSRLSDPAGRRLFDVAAVFAGDVRAVSLRHPDRHGGDARRAAAAGLAADRAEGRGVLALLWQIYSRRCFSLICLLQYGHRCGRGRTMSSTMAWRTAGRLG